jgi:mannosylglycerate hydrolase
MAEVTQLLIVPHTHWDREWYQTFQQFRMRLVRTVDRVLDVLESDPNFTDFMLDGQTIVLEDYLEVRPEQAERLQRLTRARRILVGPWYLQPDEFLVGGESLIRNLQVGMRLARAFGGAMPVGYVPDIFGHIAQLPQILRGFGLDNAVYWRGVGPEVECSEFRWVAPDGTSVLGVWLCDVGKDASEYTDGFRGYSNARTLPLETSALLARIAQIEAPLRRRATTRTLLLMNGSDHLEPQQGIPAAIAAANKSLKSAGKALAIGSLPQYIDAIKRADPPLASYTGEMRSSRYAHLLPGVLSTRMWIKQRNAACEAQLTRWAEPFSAWNWLLGTPYPVGLLRVSWRQLLYNHPHDSICGCGIDQVHAEMRPRFDQSRQIADGLTQQALAQVAEQVNTQEPAMGERAVPIVVFNPGPGPCTGAVVCDVELLSEDVVLADETGQPVPHEVRRVWHKEIADQEIAKGIVVSMLGLAEEGRIEGFAVLDVQFSMEPGGTVERVDVTVSEQGDSNPAALAAAIEHIKASERREQVTAFHFVAREVQRADLVFLATDVPSCGARTFYLRPRRPQDVASARSSVLRAEPTAIENEFYRVEVHPATGTLSVLDKATGTRYAGLNLFQDGGDVGDLYNYSPPHDDVIVANPRYRPQIELVSGGPARATLRISLRYELPARCAEDRRSRHYEMVECPIISEVSLAPGVRRIEIRTEVENLARDHRLRVLFPAPLTTDVSEAEGAFEVVRRPVRQPPPLPGETPWSAWPEAPVDTHPQKRFVDVSDGRVGLAVLNRGLPEYEVVPWPVSGGVAVALTLLRCVEWLSRADLETRRGHAGPMLHTPEAQEAGRHVFEYALVSHAGRWQADEALALAQAQAFEAPLRAQVTGTHTGRLSSAWSFLSVTPGTVAVSAVKRAEDEDALVVRLYNPMERSVDADVRLLFPFREVQLVNLNEEPLPAAEAASHHLVPIEDQGMRLALRGGEIATMLFRF